MPIDLQTGTLLLLIAAVVAILTKRLRLPYSVGLVAAGVGLAALPFMPPLALTRQFLFTVLLPPLLFDSAFRLHWEWLRRDALVIGALATAGVVLSGAVTAAGMHYTAKWHWMDALIFGALIAATDPVSVIAAFREAKAQGRLLVLIEAESLFNDGTAAVAFGVMAALAAGQRPASAQIGLMLLQTIGGGVLCGAAVALVSLLLLGRTDDHLVEITFTTVAAYGSFLLADHFGLSGVLATITAGLVMRNFRSLDGISPRGKEAIHNFWEYAGFLATSIVFLLIGIEQSHRNFLGVWLPMVIAIAFVLLGRAAAVYGCCALFMRSSTRVSARHQLILFWGGLRGALALALALSLPVNLPMREEIITISFGVVAFTVFVQGLTMTPLLRWMGEIGEKRSEA
jgi:CPA1 family monovalent cation:H+ antiporter